MTGRVIRFAAALCLVATAASAAAQSRRRQPRPAPPPVQRPVPPPARAAAPEPVMGSNARQIVARFGAPALDQQEGPGRKLQYLGAACVLDLYLYPPRGGQSEAVVTHVDARLPDGRDTDADACASAIRRQ